MSICGYGCRRYAVHPKYDMMAPLFFPALLRSFSQWEEDAFGALPQTCANHLSQFFNLLSVQKPLERLELFQGAQLHRLAVFRTIGFHCVEPAGERRSAKDFLCATIHSCIRDFVNEEKSQALQHLVIKVRRFGQTRIQKAFTVMSRNYLAFAEAMKTMRC